MNRKGRHDCEGWEGRRIKGKEEKRKVGKEGEGKEGNAGGGEKRKKKQRKIEEETAWKEESAINQRYKVLEMEKNQKKLLGDEMKGGEGEH